MVGRGLPLDLRLHLRRQGVEAEHAVCALQAKAVPFSACADASAHTMATPGITHRNVRRTEASGADPSSRRFQSPRRHKEAEADAGDARNQEADLVEAADARHAFAFKKRIKGMLS